MTETIQKAIDKIDKEADKLGGGQYQLIAEHIIKNYLFSDENANKVLDEKKSLSACMGNVKSKAQKQAQNGMAMVKDTVVFEWVADYYSFTEQQREEVEEPKIVDLFDVL